MKNLLALPLLAVAGCGSLADLPGCGPAGLEGPSPHVFGGLRSDLAIFGGGGSCKSPAYAPCAFVDLPFSAVMDVALLPVTVPISIWRPRPKTAAEATTP